MEDFKMLQIDYTIEEIKMLTDDYVYYITFINYPIMDIEKQIVYDNIENYICAIMDCITITKLKTPRGFKIVLKYPELEFLTSAIDKYIADVKHLESCYELNMEGI